jgi:acetyltransferase-like isoleucine patch superfamily enzyme
MARAHGVLEQIAARFGDCRIGPRALIRLRKNCRLQFGKHVTIGAYRVITIWLEDESCPGSAATLEVGGYRYFGELSNVRVGGTTSIEAKCQISLGISNVGSDHGFIPRISIIDQPSRTDKLRATLKGGVWHGANSRILSGVTVGSGSIVMARSVGTRDISSNVVIAGAPDRVLKD